MPAARLEIHMDPAIEEHRHGVVGTPGDDKDIEIHDRDHHDDSSPELRLR